MQLSQRGYDPSSADSILSYAERLVGHSLREVLEDLPPVIDFSSHKGGFGNTLERYYFGYEPNSRPEPDFAEAGIELKATPLKTVRGKLVAKERLVLGMIDYMNIVSEEWESSSFVKKNSHLMLVFYLHEADKDPRDFTIKCVRMWDFPADDLEIIRRDWQTIVKKVRAGLAHELSEGDTYYLGACTKSSNSLKRRSQPFSSEMAKPRAFALKASYLNTILDDARFLKPIAAEELSAGLGLEEIVAARFAPYRGMTADAIARSLGVRTHPRPKNFYALLTKRVLGLREEDRIAEFEKADINVKTIRLTASGKPKEDISFPAFRYTDLIEQEWDSSDLRSVLSKRFFFVIYQLQGDNATLLDTRFWTMPVSHIDTLARQCFEETVLRIREDRAEYLPRKSENKAVHVRPHARDSRDVLPLPSGKFLCKKSFWLNGSYIRDQLGL